MIPLIELSNIFNKICSKELEVSELDKLCNSIGETLCRLEMIFPPAFFDIMMHLPAHIAWEARLGGLFPIDRCIQWRDTYVASKVM